MAISNLENIFAKILDLCKYRIYDFKPLIVNGLLNLLGVNCIFKLYQMAQIK